MEQGAKPGEAGGNSFCVLTSLKPNVVEKIADSIPLGHIQPASTCCVLILIEKAPCIDCQSASTKDKDNMCTAVVGVVVVQY